MFLLGPQKQLLRQDMLFLLVSLTQVLVGDGEVGLLLVEVLRVQIAHATPTAHLLLAGVCSLYVLGSG